MTSRASDAVVIGGGPAGLSAATWLARYRRKVPVLDSGEYRNAAVTEAHGYHGMDGFDPRALRDRARADLATCATAVLRDECAPSVHRIAGDLLQVEVGQGRNECARRLVLATGVRDRLPEIDGILEHSGA